MRECTERSLALYEKVGDSRGAAYALRTLAFSLLQMGKLDEAYDVLARAIAALRQLGDEVGVASCLSLQGMSAHNRRDFGAGRKFYAQALAAHRRLGDEVAIATVLGNFAELEFADGHPDRALGLVNEALLIRSRGKEKTDLCIDLNNSSAYHMALGELDEAREAARETLRWAQPEQNSWNTSVALQHLALLAALNGHADAAARLIGYVNKQFAELGLQREPAEEWGYERLMSSLREAFGEAEMASLVDVGAGLTEEQALEEALAT